MDRVLDENYKDLANAIIRVAVQDYSCCLADIPIRYGKTVTLDSLERFFNSEWFKMLTNVDAEYIKAEIKKECGRYDKRRID